MTEYNNQSGPNSYDLYYITEPSIRTVVAEVFRDKLVRDNRILNATITWELRQLGFGLEEKVSIPKDDSF